MTEPTGEQFHNSSELGFVFGLMPAEHAVSRLRTPPFTKNLELQRYVSQLEMVSEVFSRGLPRSAWTGYCEIQQVDVSIYRGVPGGDEIIQAYTALLEKAQAATVSEIEQYLEIINTFLAENPTLVRGEQDSAAPSVTSLVGEWQEYSDKQPPSKPPVRLAAELSDGTTDTCEFGSTAIIDSNELPEYVKEALKQYHYLYYA